MKIVIADDHPIFRSGLKFLLESSFEKVHVTDFDNGASVLVHLESNHPDLVFLDIDMPQKNGLDTVPKLLNRFLRSMW